MIILYMIIILWYFDIWLLYLWLWLSCEMWLHFYIFENSISHGTYSLLLTTVFRSLRNTSRLMEAPDDERETNIRYRAGHVTRIAKSGSSDHLLCVDVNGDPETRHGEQFSSSRSRFAYEPNWPSFAHIIPCGSLLMQTFLTTPSLITWNPLFGLGNGFFNAFGFTETF
jgi:hypothetical protein